MKKQFLLILSICITHFVTAQVKWSTDTTSADHLSWNNFSSTYIGDISESIPFLVAAIPYNGVYSNQANTPLDLSFEGSLFRFRSGLGDKALKLTTYDSSDVYFLTPGIYKSNAARYEYRVSLNATTVIKPWTVINRFSDLQLSTFKHGDGFLGGYATGWGNFITVELRKKDSDTSFTSATVYWKEKKPTLARIYTSKNLNDFLILLKRPWDRNLKPTTLPEKATFPSSENTFIFYLAEEIYKRDALEYRLIKNGKNYLAWKQNDYDNNFVLLHTLPPGNYTIEIRYRRQRHSVTSYHFTILPQWQQTTFFKISAGLLIAGLFASVILIFRTRQQKKQLQQTQLNKEKLQLQLQSLRSQLNPHFIFNALNSIQGLINKKDATTASHYLSAFGDLLRQTLQYNNHELLPMESEIKMLETYTRLEQLRFGFKYLFTVDNDLPAASIEIPTLLVQPLIENAVKHGVSGLQEKGEINIHFYRQSSTLLIMVKDNGAGVDMEKNNTGHGLRLTRERIALLNRSLKGQSIELTIESNQPAGAMVTLHFYHWLS